MNGAPYTHLIWKEYRAIRGFWIALIALAVFMQLLVLAFSQDRGWAIEFVYNIALATPVFFAIGCIGTAYAIEKEDGTFEWLRSSPARDAQLFVSKVGLCFVATVAMFAILWLLTQTLLVAPPAKSDVVRGMLGLWLLAGLEALAWGLLFSLLSARPLMAIVLALFATSTAIHVLSWIVQPVHPDQFEYSRYVAAIPLRLGLLAAVVAADVYLGLRWLGSEERTSLLSPREVEDASARRPATKSDITTLLTRRDRGAILGRLLWQQLRQSGRLMFTLAALQVVASLVAANSGLDSSRYPSLPFIPLIAFAALMGASVFQADQQRGHFRFFVERNVPPRYVWFTRLAAWLPTLAISTLISALVWVGVRPLGELFVLVLNLRYAWLDPYNLDFYFGDLRDFSDLFQSAPIILSSLAVIPAFAAGQWVSMTVRSGLLAGFFSLLLTLALVTWCAAVFAMKLSWLLFLVPIPFVFLWASWLRAPDWILEKTTWPARFKAAGAVLVPALVLLLAAPVARIEQVPVVSPGFDQAAFVAEITPAALKTGEMYRRANELYDSNAPYSERVSANQESLDLILQASQRNACALANPATLTNWPVIPDGRLVSLTNFSARELRREKNLEAALDRYFTAFTVEHQLSSFAPKLDVYPMPVQSMEIMQLLTQWASQPGQTAADIQQAIAGLELIDSKNLNWDDALKSNYILCGRLLDGDESVVPVLYPGKNSAKHIARISLYLRLLPWERVRERRALAVALQQGLSRLGTVRTRMEGGDYAAEWADPNRPYATSDNTFSDLAAKMKTWSDDALVGEVSFETRRRVTLLILACQAYRLKHDALPERLEQLREEGILAEIPNDPMSGRPFVYFPEGVPAPRTEREKRAVENRSVRHSNQLSDDTLRPGIPGIWSPGLSLEPRGSSETDAEGKTIDDVFYVYRFGQGWRARYLYAQQLPDYVAWLHGEWFPIPEKQ